MFQVYKLVTMSYILFLAFVFFSCNTGQEQTPSTSSFQQALKECLESQVLNDYVLDHTEKDTVLVNLYGYELPEQFITLSKGRVSVVHLVSKEGKFNNDELYLKAEELSGIKCQTRNQLDCVFYPEDEKSYVIGILFRCNATIVRSIYEFNDDRVELKSRVKSRY